MDDLKKRFAQFTGEGDEELEISDAEVEETEAVPSREESDESPKSKFFPRLTSFTLLASVFLMPLFFLPALSAHFLFTKQLIFVTAVLFAVGVWLYKTGGAGHWPTCGRR